MSALFALILPLVLLAALAGPARSRAAALVAAPWAPLALTAPLVFGDRLTLQWTLLGVTLGPDGVSRPLLLLTLVVWSLAGWYARAHVTERRRWFWCGWLGSLAGMQLVLLAGDIASFYLGYAALGFSAYLLVTHAMSAESWRAGRVYLVMALAAEAALLVGLLMIAGLHGNAPFALLQAQPAALLESPARWLLFAGFAVKLGILPLHLWLPLAHPVAPIPASAILSGVIVKAGLMGWLRFVPALVGDPKPLGIALFALGMATSFGGVALGLTQARLKPVLAYSTISQMGLVLSGFALTLLLPEEREALLALLGLLALHHGLNKASLFVACGCAPGASRGRLFLFALPALSLAATPLTTGFFAKDALKSALTQAGLGSLAGGLLALSSTATALLVWKAFELAKEQRDGRTPLHPAWPCLVIAAALVPCLHAAGHGLLVWPAGGKLLEAAWPLLLAAGLCFAHRRLLGGRNLRLPEGDLVVLLERPFARRSAPAGKDAEEPERPPRFAALGSGLLAVERTAQRIWAVGLALLLLGLALGGSLLWSGPP